MVRKLEPLPRIEGWRTDEERNWLTVSPWLNWDKDWPEYLITLVDFLQQNQSAWVSRFPLQSSVISLEKYVAYIGSLATPLPPLPPGVAMMVQGTEWLDNPYLVEFGERAVPPIRLVHSRPAPPWSQPIRAQYLDQWQVSNLTRGCSSLQFLHGSLGWVEQPDSELY